MNRLLSLAAVPALALLLGLPARAAVPLGCTPVHSGDKVTGEIGAGGDRDSFQVHVPDGARLAVSVKAARGQPLLPTIEVLDPEGTPIDLVKLILIGELTPWAHFDNLGIHETGDYVVVVGGNGATAGRYTAVISVLMEKSVKATVQVPAGGTVTLPFAATGGSKVSFSVSEAAGALASADLLSPAGDALPGTGGIRKGRKLAARALPLTSGDGLYALRLVGGPTASSVSVKTKVAFPRVKPVKILLGEEPRPTAMTPNLGPDAVPFVITGTGFGPGATVYFGGTVQATGVQVVSSTEIRGLTPGGPDAETGGPVAVTVVNVDGQAGSLAVPYNYLGKPAVASAQPPMSPIQGGQVVDLFGKNFRPGFSVEVGGVPATGTVFVSSINVRFTAPARASGETEIVLFDEFDRPGTPLAGFWYADVPSVAAADPDVLPSFGGRTVTLAGAEFTPFDTVLVGGNAATGVRFVDMGTLTFDCPPADSGTVTVEVRDVLGRSGSAPVLVLTPSLQDVTATALPAAPQEGDFAGLTLATGDLNGDGASEILVGLAQARKHPQTNQITQSSWLLENDGSGTFSNVTGSKFPASTAYLDRGQADAAAIGDLDGDGAREILTSKGTPLREQSYAVDYYGYQAYFDINFPYSMDPPLQSALRVLENGGSGSFSDKTSSIVYPSYSTPAYGRGEAFQASAMALGDLDSDGDLDALIVAPGEVRNGYVNGSVWTYKIVKVKGYYYYYYYYYRDKLLLSQGTYQVAAARVLGNSYGTLYDAVRPDMVVDGGGTVLDDFRGIATALGDLDGDGDLDGVILSDKATLRDNGGIEFAPAVRVLVSYYGFPMFNPSAIPDNASGDGGEYWQGKALALGDLDGDGDLDMAVGRDKVDYWVDGTQNRLRPAIMLFRNDGSGSFSEDTGGFLPAEAFSEGSPSTVLGASGILIADLDADGDNDLLVTSSQAVVQGPPGGYGPKGILPAGTKSATRILLNDGAGGFADATDEWIRPGSTLQAERAAILDLDGDGGVDVVLTSNTAPTGARPVRVLHSR